MAHLFSYGSNHPGQLAARLGHSVTTQGAYLPNYGRVFRGFSQRWGGGVASVVPMRAIVTYGHVMQVTSADLATLDRVEGVPTYYRRKKLVVYKPDNSPVSAWVYVAQRGDFNEPSRAYLEAIAKTIGAHWTGDGGRAITWRDVTVR